MLFLTTGARGTHHVEGGLERGGLELVHEDEEALVKAKLVGERAVHSEREKSMFISHQQFNATLLTVSVRIASAPTLR